MRLMFFVKTRREEDMKTNNFKIKALGLALTAAMGLSTQVYADIKIGVAGPHTCV